MGALEQGRGSNSTPKHSMCDHPVHAATARGLQPPVDAAVLTGHYGFSAGIAVKRLNDETAPSNKSKALGSLIDNALLRAAVELTSGNPPSSRTSPYLSDHGAPVIDELGQHHGHVVIDGGGVIRPFS